MHDDTRSTSTRPELERERPPGDDGARLAGVPVEFEDPAPLELGDGYAVSVEDGMVVLRLYGEVEVVATAVQWRQALQLVQEGQR